MKAGRSALIIWFAALPAVAGPAALLFARSVNAADRPLEERLLLEDPAALALEARARGDAARGAVLFHQPSLGCARCHSAEGKEPPAPDLAAGGEGSTGAHLVESVLSPSRAIRKGFEGVTLLTREGLLLTGLLIGEDEEGVRLRDSSRDFQAVRIPRPAIRERAAGAGSLMPAGLVNQLSGRAQFLDLAAYLIEIAEQGPARALELKPAPQRIAPPPLPEHERDLDHAGLLRALDGESFRRGEATYHRFCINCHGTREEPGSLPAAPRFASAVFKNGSDPHGMYRTLTRGFGLMAAQPWMVPREKYDVIHYIREAYLKEHNPARYVPLDEEYLGRLPAGKEKGPEPSTIEPWAILDHGRSLMGTFEVGKDGSNFAHKGIAVRLDPGPGGVSRGARWMLFDHDTLRVAAAWSGPGFIDWNSIHFNGRHAVHPRIVGRVRFSNPTGPGWARPGDGSWDDPRLRGRDGRPYGPLPRGWARYRGLHHHGDRVVISYTVGDAEVLEAPGMLAGHPASPDLRTFQIGSRSGELVMQVAHRRGAADSLSAGLMGNAGGARLESGPAGDLRLRIPPGAGTLRFSIWLAPGENPAGAGDPRASLPDAAPEDLDGLTRGGPPRWAQTLSTAARTASGDGPLAVDELSHPAQNPWLSPMRFTGLDFLDGGDRAAVSTWDGEVWVVEGIDRPEGGLRWRRIAAGLFQPLGLKALRGKVHVACRDQIAVLHDRNGDGETDFYECFNNDHQVTEHFHEFAMGLEADAEGNLYYAKAARHALPPLVPHHGTLLKVSADGARTEVLATGFRAPNGVCLNGDGTFFITDQEGHWLPKNRINRVRPGGFYGNRWGYHEAGASADPPVEEPVAWITNSFDRSPAELVRVPGGAFGPLAGSLLDISYGHGKLFLVLHETVNGRMQGALCELPAGTFPTGIMRGRFHPGSGDLFLAGMFAWAGNREAPGGLFRVRYRGGPLHVPVGIEARKEELRLRFTDPLDARAAEDTRRFAIKVWSLRRSADYGSPHVDERPLRLAASRLGQDRKTVHLALPDLAPTMGLEVRYSLKAEDGRPVEGLVHGTVHALGER